MGLRLVPCTAGLRFYPIRYCICQAADATALAGLLPRRRRHQLVRATQLEVVSCTRRNRLQHLSLARHRAVHRLPSGYWRRTIGGADTDTALVGRDGHRAAVDRELLYHLPLDREARHEQF